ncbi:MAG: diphosphomevalonate decarboxylase [Gammaproteobacteria bacterium]|jgi:diphosphomevalonate decarboxylase|nr:diphosphomevalonate decarboxylase [Chromatiales bacterium]MDP6673426.1 diphosphomevalonate decarboxylase [Gammaproteobacteria bacterium]
MHASAIAHPNVALIKYWGKRDIAENLPAVGSLSVTLGALSTETTVEFDPALKRDVLVLNGHEQPLEQGRLTACMDAFRALAGSDEYATVTSVNDFPTGAGLASSASGYAALVTAAAAALGLDQHESGSSPGSGLIDVARIGSGSAPRSLFGGVVLLSIDEHGTNCRQLTAPAEWPLSVAVAVTTESKKNITSRDGMEQSRLTSPFYEEWIHSHADDLNAGIRCAEAHDFPALGKLAEHNCLKMHSVMMTTQPALLYWSPVTLACMYKVMSLRADGIPVFFTIDAGPQLKAVCLPDALATVTAALHDVPGVLRIIAGELGEGASVADR